MDTNIFSEGAIYFYENKSHTKKDYDDPSLNHDFIVSRPVYILDFPELPFNTYTITVCVITSSNNRIGIPIKIDNAREGRILPSAIHSLHKENLTKYMGHANNEIQQKVKEAVAFHMGLSKEIPTYLKEYQELLGKREKMIKELSPLEHTVNDFMKEKCYFKEEHFVSANDLFNEYLTHSNNEGYTRLSDFTRCVTKLELLYPTYTYVNTSLKKEFSGFSIKGMTHRRSSTVAKSVEVANLANSNKKDIEILQMEKDQLIDSLTDDGKRAYYKLDNMQKFDIYKGYDKFEPNINIEEFDIQIINRLIELDTDSIIEKVKRQLRNGAPPLSLSQTNCYIACHLPDKVLDECVQARYKKKGVSKLKKSMRQSVSYLIKRRRQ